MRVLFTVNPGTTIFNHLVPLAWALRTAGHEVRVASQPLFADEITRSGLTAVGVGRNLGIKRLLVAQGATEDTIQESRRGLPQPYCVAEDPDSLDWEESMMAWHYNVEHAKYETVAITAGLVEFARHWQPDLVIWEPFTPAGPIVAKACGAAHGRLIYGVDVFGLSRQHYLRLQAEQEPEHRGDPLADWLGGYARKYGGEYTEDMVTGQFTIDHMPASLQVEADGLDYRRMQYIPYGGPAVVPAWLQKPAQRPRVAITMGISATQFFGGYNIPFTDVLDSLADLDVEIVATVAESEQHKLGKTPDNARIVDYAPLHALASTCSAIIHHAGAATLATVARHPIPHLSLHYHWDQPFLAKLLTQHGAGLDIHTTEVTGDNVRASLLRLLNEPRFTQRATDLRDEMFALPSPNELVHQLEELTTKHRTR